MVIPLFIIISIACTTLFPQEQREISAQKEMLTSLRNEINQLEKQISEKNKAEKKTFSTIETMKKQVFIINRMLMTLRNEERKKDQEIASTSFEIGKIEQNIAALKDNYSRSIVGLYKYGKPTELELILNSENVSQALLRKEYLERFSKRRESDIKSLKLNIRTLNKLMARLEKEREEKQLLSSEKSKEELKLKDKINDNKKLISEIKKNKTELKKEVDSRKKEESKIKNLINKLIADAEKKKKEEKERLAELEKKRKAGENVNENEFQNNFNANGLSSFRGMKGKLKWPVNGGKVVGKFGENKHQVLKTVTLNYGIDILTGSNSDVKSVADGIVSAIDWIPGYGSVVIVTHAEEFRTVYSRLSEIFVSEGDKVQTGSVIARVTDSLEGKILHFEIWNSRSNQNPEIWLARK